MGGLRHALPTTYWTFVAGALAIAGVPGLAGFFSKDAILYHTFANGHAVLWVVGLLTSLLTAIYMFRLVILAFHGERSGGHAGAHLHDAPPAMAAALVTLAVGSVVAGYAGFPALLGGGDRFGRFLEPVFTAGGVALAGTPAGAQASGAFEGILMAVSAAAAIGGIGLAMYFFLHGGRAATLLAERFPALYRVLVRKLYVDEVYDAAIVQPIRIVSEDGLWKGIDAGVIDRSVNGVGDVVRAAAEVMRRAQTGSLRAYAASLLVGVVLIMGYYLW
jgi:NADH-quinone oxidoreductase subunit L